MNPNNERRRIPANSWDTSIAKAFSMASGGEIVNANVYDKMNAELFMPDSGVELQNLALLKPMTNDERSNWYLNTEIFAPEELETPPVKKPEPVVEAPVATAPVQENIFDQIKSRYEALPKWQKQSIIGLAVLTFIAMISKK